MIRPVHQILFLMELLSWSLTIIVVASQQPRLSAIYSENNIQVWINGSHSGRENVKGIVASPGYPATSLPQAATYTYHFNHHNKRGRVLLKFSDFFLSTFKEHLECGSEEGSGDSYIKILDGTHLTTLCGQSRPHPYVSSSHHLTLEYHPAPNNNPSLFRAQYRFLSRGEAVTERERLNKGYYVQETEFLSEGFGDLHPILPPVNWPRNVDYLWYIQAPADRVVHLNVIELNISENTTFTVHDGPSSGAEILSKLEGNFSLIEGSRAITSTQPWVYARWAGEAEGWNRLQVVFTEASKPDSQGFCPQDFTSCQSKICIPGQRLCDGTSHCAQGEDEDEGRCPLMNKPDMRVLSRRQSIVPIDLSDCHCENGGTCVRDKLGGSVDEEGQSKKYYCLCEDEYFGDRCEVMSLAKRQHLAVAAARCVCKNGGTCTPTSSGFGFVCACSAGFHGYDCSLNNSSLHGVSSPTEYGIAMGAAVVAVLLVMFGVALCICVILQYLRQQRDGPESPYSRTLSRDVYSVEGVDIAGLQMESVEPNDYIPPSYNQCMHPSPSSPEGEVFLTPSQSSQFSMGSRVGGSRLGSRWRVRTPESPPPTYDAILGFCKECSELALRNLAKQQQHNNQLQTPTSEQYDSMSGVSSNYTTGNNTPSGAMPFPSQHFLSRRGSRRGQGTSSQSQTDSPLEEFELRRVQST